MVPCINRIKVRAEIEGKQAYEEIKKLLMEKLLNSPEFQKAFNDSALLFYEYGGGKPQRTTGELDIVILNRYAVLNIGRGPLSDIVDITRQIEDEFKRREGH